MDDNKPKKDILPPPLPPFMWHNEGMEVSGKMRSEPVDEETNMRKETRRTVRSARIREVHTPTSVSTTATFRKRTSRNQQNQQSYQAQIEQANAEGQARQNQEQSGNTTIRRKKKSSLARKVAYWAIASSVMAAGSATASAMAISQIIK